MCTLNCITIVIIFIILNNFVNKRDNGSNKTIEDVKKEIANVVEQSIELDNKLN